MDMGNEPEGLGRQVKRARQSDPSYTGSLGVQTLLPGNGKQRASFDFFKDAPLDIIREVLDYLSPLDLLQLSRAAKVLRGFLMSKFSSSSSWKSALAAIDGLPPCPEDLVEPQYANLIFGRHCHVCLVESDYLLKYMEARVRLCQTCSVYEFSPWNELSGKIDKRLESLIPCIFAKSTSHEREIKHAICEFEQNGSQEQRTRYFHAATAVKLNKELEALGNEKLEATWLENQRVAWIRVKEHSDACCKYASRLIQIEKERATHARYRRRKQLREKLVGLGWEREWGVMDLFITDTADSPCRALYLHRAEELTEQEWEETKADWLILMEDIRHLTRRAQFIALVQTQIVPVYSQYVLSQPPKVVVPTLAEVVVMDEILPILGRYVLDQDSLWSDGILHSALARLPGLVTKWRLEQEEVLMQALRKSTAYACKEVPEGVLSYASTVFSCTQCGDVLSYPTLFVHECFLRLTCPDSGERTSKEERGQERGQELPAPGGVLAQEALDRIAHDAFKSTRSWQPGSDLIFHDPGYHHTIVILDLLGLERTTTTEVLCQLNPYLECRCECFQGLRGSKMGWMEALKHCKQRHLYEGSFAIVGIPGICTEDTWEQIPKYTSLCPLCQQWQADSGQVVQHYRSHGCSQADAQAFDSRALKKFKQTTFIGRITELAAGIALKTKIINDS